MSHKTLIKWSLLVIVLSIGIVFSSMLVLSMNRTQSQLPQNQNLAIVTQKPVQTQPGLLAPEVKGATLNQPSSFRLKIPQINLDAAIESVGLTAQNAMDAPKGPNNVAWFDLGPRPGEQGSAVIDGHSGWWKDGTPAIFDNLYKLQKGDLISVEDANGVSTTFVVRESRNYNPDSDASDVFQSNDGKAHLNLITCEGVWNEAQKSYSSRLVVFADQQTN